MITRVDVMSENAFYIPILGVTPKDSILIRKITGLNPPDRNLFIGEYARDGGTYQGNRVGNRNIVITMDLNPNPALGETVSGMRKMLYKAFMDPQPNADHLKFVFYDEDNNELYTVGYAEKFETDIFDVETLCQVSLICPDPFLRDNEETLLTNDGGWLTVPFDYDGSAETGFEAYIMVTSATSDLRLEVNGIEMILDRSFVAGDSIYISTNRGSRAITLAFASDLGSEPSYYNTETTYDIGDTCFYDGAIWKKIDELDIYAVPPDSPGEWEQVSESGITYLTPTSDWLELHAQSNVVKVHGPEESDTTAVIKAFAFTSAHWGL